MDMEKDSQVCNRQYHPYNLEYESAHVFCIMDHLELSGRRNFILPEHLMNILALIPFIDFDYVLELIF